MCIDVRVWSKGIRRSTLLTVQEIIFPILKSYQVPTLTCHGPSQFRYCFMLQHLRAKIPKDMYEHFYKAKSAQTYFSDFCIFCIPKAYPRRTSLGVSRWVKFTPPKFPGSPPKRKKNCPKPIKIRIFSISGFVSATSPLGTNHVASWP